MMLLQAIAALLVLFLPNRSVQAYPIVSFICKDLGPLARPDSLCLDVPLYCLIRVDPSSPCGGNNLTAANLSITVEVNDETNTPAFDLVREESHLLGMHIDYRPTGFNETKTLKVRASSMQENCSFAVSTENPVVTDCTYPLHVLYGDFPVFVDPGDVFLYGVNFSQSNYDVIENVSLSIRHHRSLSVELLSVVGGNKKSCSSLACVDVLSNKISILTMRITISTVILPHTTLFIDFVTMHTTSESPYPTITVQSFIIASSVQELILQPSFLSNPHYLSADISPFSFPPQVDEPYHFKVSVSFPCVTTKITIAVQIPKFFAVETGEAFFLNVTKVEQIGNISSFLSYSSGTTSPLNSTDFPRIQIINGFNSTEQVIAEFGALQQTRPCQNWTSLILLLEGVSLTRLPSRYVALHERFTVSLTYTAGGGAEDNSSLGMDTERTVTVHDILNVNVTRPDLSLSVSTHTHDAKDRLVMKFSVSHNGTSGVSAWNLSYTFQVDRRLEVADHITYCHTAGRIENCVDLPFINHTIRGFFEKFRLKVDKVNYSLNVTVPQNVAPGIKLPANGTATYRSAALDHPVTGLQYTNTSKGGVNIILVILHPWEYNNSSLIATPTESHSKHYVAIGETVDMSIQARMPECFTSITLKSTIPNSVTLNNATVVRVGSELWNRTLEVGDSLAGSDFIQQSGLAVDFNFGYNVTVPGNNTIISDEQDFTIGLQTTVLNVPELVEGTRLEYTAFVQTDFGKKTPTRKGYITITEPKLQFGPMNDQNKYDAGDTANVIVSITHSGSPESLFTNAFRVILTISYPTEFLQLNNSSPTVRVGGVQLPSESITYDTVAGTLTFNVTELDKTESITASMDYRLQNDVQSDQVIPLDLKLTWDSLPYGKSGGRNYSASGTHMLKVKSPKLYLDFVTSNPDTPGFVLQVGESVSFNVTIVPPEGGADVVLDLNSTLDTGTSPMNFTSASVVYVGAALNTSLAEGDVTNSTHSDPLITLLDMNSARFNIGRVNNSFDNEENNYDYLVLQVNGYIADLASLSDTVIWIHVTAVITTEPDLKANLDLQLHHPLLKLYFDSENPSPVDAGDEFFYHIGLHNDRALTSSYDVILDVFLLDPFQNILELPYKNATFYSTNCDTRTNSTVSKGRFYFSIGRIVPDCVWYTSATMTLPNDLTADYYFTVGVELTSYDSSPDPPPRNGKVYGKLSKTMDISSLIPQLSLKITKGLPSVPLPYVSPAEPLILEYTLTLPEGIIQNLSTEINTTVDCDYCSPFELNLTRVELGSNINVTQPMHLNQYHFFGDTHNLPDNVKNSSDNILIFSELRVPTNTTDTNFTVTFKKSYTSINGPKNQTENDSFIIVRPQLNAAEITSAHVVDLGTNLTVTILVNITSPTPAFHISINITIPDPLLVVHTTINATGTNVTNSSSQSYDEGTILSLYANQLTGNETVRVIVYGYISPDAERGISIKPLADMDYTSLPGEGMDAGERYHDVIPLPSLVISSLNTNLTLLSTSEKLTIDNSLTFNEVGEFDAVFSRLVGPMDELTITVSHDGASLINVLGIKLSYKGYTPEYIGTPVITKVNSTHHKITFTRASVDSPISACSTINSTSNCSLTLTISAVAIDKNSFQDSVRLTVAAQHGVSRYNSSFEIDLNTPLLELTMASNTTTFDRGDFVKLSFQITSKYNGAHLVKAHIEMPCRCRAPPVSTIASNHPVNSITFNDTVMIIEFDYIPENFTVNGSFVIDSTFPILLGQKFNFTGMLFYRSLSANASEANAVYSGQLSNDEHVVVNLTVESPRLIKPFLLPDNMQTPNKGYYVASGLKVPIKYSLALQEVNTNLQLILAFKNTSTIPSADQFFNITTGKDVVLTDRDHLTDHINCNSSTKTCVIDFGEVENLGRSKGEGFVDFSFFLQLRNLEAGEVGRIEASIKYTNAIDTDTQPLNSVDLLVREPMMSITSFTHDLHKAADSGDIITMAVTVNHSNGSVVPAINPTFVLSNLHSLLRLVGNASVTVGDTTRVLSASDLVNGLVAPNVAQADGMVLKFQVQLQDSVRLNSDILLNISLKYGENGNLSTSAPMFTPITTPSLSFPSLRLINSSLSATDDKLLSIEEIFVLAADLSLPEASMNVSLTLEITSDLEQLPVKFLDSELTFPARSVSMQTNQNTNIYRSTISHALNTSLVIPGTTSNAEKTMRLTVVAVVTDDAANGTKVRATVKTRTLQDSTIRTASYNLTIMEPQLEVVENKKVLETGNPQLVMVNITVSHSAVSNFPALSFTLEKSLPSLLLLQQSSLTSNVDVTMVSTQSSTILRAYKAMLAPSSSITIGFLVQADKKAPSLQKLNNSLTVNYSSILPEDGLGTLFPLYTGKEYTHERSSCIQKIDKPFRSNLDVVLSIVSFLIGVLIGIAIVITCFACFKLGCCCCCSKAVPAVVAAAVTQSTEEDYYIFDDRWFPYSSLLYAVPEYQWRKRTDSYERKVEQYTWLMEEELYMIQIKAMMKVAFKIIMTTKLLSDKGRAQLLRDLQHTVREVKLSLSESWKKEFERITNSESQEAYETESISLVTQLVTDSPEEEIKGFVLKDCNSFHLSEETNQGSAHVLEKELSILEWRVKFMSHYHLWVKASIVSVLQLPSFTDEDRLIKLFEEENTKIEEEMAEAHCEIEEMIVQRFEREKRTLMRKLMLEEEDIMQCQWLVKQFDSAVAAGLIRPTFESPYASMLRLKSQLTEAMEQFRRSLTKKEQEVTTDSKFHLDELVRKAGLTLYGNDFKDWVDIVHKSENALKTVEEKAIQRLLSIWRQHQTDREEIIRSMLSLLTNQLITIGSMDFVGEREKVQDSLEKGQLLQKARLQAQFDSRREKTEKMKQLLPYFYSDRREREGAFLSKVLSAFTEQEKMQIVDEHYKAARLNLLSCGLYRLDIHQAAVRSSAKKRFTKIKVFWKKWQLQHKKLKERPSDDVNFCELWSITCYLIKCECTGWQSETTTYAEESKQKETEQEMIKDSSKIPDNIRYQLISTRLPPLAMIETGISQPLPSDHESLIQKHMEGLEDVSSRLEEDKTRATRELELKIRRKKYFKEKRMSVIHLSKGEGPSPFGQFSRSSVNSSRFRRSVMKIIHQIREEKFKAKQEQQLQRELELLEKEYNAKKAREFERLERKFEKNLVELGHLSENQLAVVLRNANSWKQLRMRPLQKRSGSDYCPEVNETGDYKLHFLPPMRRGRRDTN